MKGTRGLPYHNNGFSFWGGCNAAATSASLSLCEFGIRLLGETPWLDPVGAQRSQTKHTQAACLLLRGPIIVRSRVRSGLHGVRRIIILAATLLGIAVRPHEAFALSESPNPLRQA